MAHNSLPMRQKIAAKGIELDTRCLLCYGVDEDGVIFSNANMPRLFGGNCSWRTHIWYRLHCHHQKMSSITFGATSRNFRSS
uniref:Uncharacterized protein n=1 Tax=Arundo donax TaxID=35708 RepID=A0A0A9B6H6_ARUDO